MKKLIFLPLSCQVERKKNLLGNLWRKTAWGDDAMYMLYVNSKYVGNFFKKFIKN
jgi:hypothetical protein